MNSKHVNKLKLLTYESSNTLTKTELVDSLVTKINGLLNSEFEANEMKASGIEGSNLVRAEKDSIKMFAHSLPQFLHYLQVEYFPTIQMFKKETDTYKFESPLNFLMMRSDFKEFLESFY